VELHTLRDPQAVNGVVVRLLAAYGVPEQSSRVEVYPRGQYRLRGPQNRVRLPFGSGSIALDPFTLDRLTRGGPLDDLRHVAAHLGRGLVPLIEAEEWLEEAKSLPPVARRRTTAARKGRTTSAPRSAAEHTSAGLDLDALWTTGLTGNGQFNEAVWTLGRDLRRRGLSREEAKSRLSEWLDQKHNRCSRTYNAFPAVAHQEIEEVMGRLYSGASSAGDWGPLPGLSEWEAAGLIEATRLDSQLADPETGEVLNRFKVQQLGFEVLRHGKQWVLREVRWRLADLQASQPNLDCRSAEFATALAPTVAPFWPDIKRPEFIVPVPFKLRLAVPGIGKDTQWALWRVLQEQGICKLERVASAEAHRAATYRMTLDFAALSPEVITLDSLPSALNTLLSPDEIRAMYSRHYARRIRAASRSRIPTAEEDIAIVVIRTLLSSARRLTLCRRRRRGWVARTRAPGFGRGYTPRLKQGSSRRLRSPLLPTTPPASAKWWRSSRPARRFPCHASGCWSYWSSWLAQRVSRPMMADTYPTCGSMG
jgi:hypothetical protein